MFKQKLGFSRKMFSHNVTCKNSNQKCKTNFGQHLGIQEKLATNAIIYLNKKIPSQQCFFTSLTWNLASIKLIQYKNVNTLRLKNV